MDDDKETSDLPSITLSIAVYVGSPVDYQHLRQTALVFRFSNDSSPTIVKIIGASRAYELETKHNHDPSEDKNLAKEVLVGSLTQSMSRERIAALVAATPVDNSNLEFNGQIWVGEALKDLAAKDLLGRDDCTNGINKMVDATLEASEHVSS